MRRPRLRSWRHWTVRSRMVVVVVALAAIALVLTNIAAVTALRPVFYERVDDHAQQISTMAGRMDRLQANGQGGLLNRASASPAPSGSADPTPSPRPSTGGRNGERPGPDGRGVPLPGSPAFAAGAPYTVFMSYDAAGNVTTPLSTPDGFFSAGELTTAAELAAAPELGSYEELKAHDSKPFTVDSNDGAEQYRVVVTPRPGGGIAVGASRLDQADDALNVIFLMGLGFSALMVLVLGFAAHTVVRIGLKPLTNMEHAAAEIASGDLTVRVPDTDPHTEPGRLGLALNAMLARVESAVSARTASEQRLRQFLADASHELRTPLTSIRGFAELYRRGGGRSGPELDETMSRIEQEAARMGLLVEDLLLLAALDEERPMQVKPVDLLVVAADIVRDAHVRSPLRTVELAGYEPVTVLGDEHRLRQVLTNLLANAIQHTPASAKVTVRLSRRGGPDGFELPVARDPAPMVAAIGADLPVPTEAAVLEVSDTGPGVPPEHSEWIFERLYRADPHRARTHGGAGLGLSIAAAIVKAHGGRIELLTAPGAGATFRVLLPLAP
jgi:two-component system, OmpR family, sensor kinase